MNGYAEVALHLARLQGSFTYHIPADLDSSLRPGHLVVVPFGTRRVQGVVLRRVSESPVPETRPIESLVDPEPVLTTAQLELAEWIHTATHTPLGDCTSIMLPAGLGQHADTEYRLADPDFAPEPGLSTRLVDQLRTQGPLRGRQIDRRLPRTNWKRSAQRLVRQGVVVQTPVLEAPRARPGRVRTARLAVPERDGRAAMQDLGQGKAAARRRAALQVLLDEGKPLEVTWVFAEAGATPHDLRDLQRRGLIELEAAEVLRDPLADLDVAPSEPPTLTADQDAVWSRLQAALAAPASSAFLLYGVTGSGKTEIYLRAVARVVASGGTAIVLVPEISLTPQTIRRFVARLGDKVGVLHSRLGTGERYDTWRRARAGQLRVILGPRSALFAPLPDLRLVIVDEEHDESYKETERAPRFHAREAALAYAGLVSGVCLLGSATPDVVTYHRAQAGFLGLLTLPERVVGRRRQAPGLAAEPGPSAERGQPAIDLPQVHVVDMRRELKAGNTSLFSRRLEEALGQTLSNGSQAILFLNRRGSATYVFCRDCGWVARCPRCETPLTHHPSAEALRCHHCGYRRKPPRRCPSCGGSRVRYFGAGTQRIQAEVESRFPGARTLRWDWDVTRRKGAHEVILGHFAAHRADILIGTQMLAKGLDLPLVTLVGVISADTGLFLPDFRAAERVFQVLTQVAGRAGRGPLGGQVILQTYHPEHEVIRAVAGHDYGAFYSGEIAHRRYLGYPPFLRLVRLLFRSPSLDGADREAARLARRLRADARRRSDSPEVLGPTPCFFPRVRGLYRWQILLRGTDPTVLIPDDLPEGWAVDVDPVNLL